MRIMCQYYCIHNRVACQIFSLAFSPLLPMLLFSVCLNRPDVVNIENLQMLESDYRKTRDS